MDQSTRCSQCQLYAELKEPFHYDAPGYPEGVTVHGFCSKDNSPWVSKFYPIYLPNGGVCKSYIKKQGGKNEINDL